MTALDWLKHLTLSMKERGILPAKIDVANIGGIRLVNSYNTVSNKIISDSITTGTDADISTATTKALTEFIERLAFIEGHHNGVTECQTERSDGFAAYPMKLEGAKVKARQNALNEAIERFVWANWWDNSEIGFSFQTTTTSSDSFGLPAKALLKKADEIAAISAIKIVKPYFNDQSKEVVILIAYLKNGGVISGGACGEIDSPSPTILRAASELFRHALAAKKIIQSQIVPQSFYEKRLAYFLTSEGVTLLNSRLSAKGSGSVALPELIFDNEIPHSNSDLAYVHRCLFKNQPPFVGGDIKRLCL